MIADEIARLVGMAVVIELLLHKDVKECAEVDLLMDRPCLLAFIVFAPIASKLRGMLHAYGGAEGGVGVERRYRRL